MKLVREMNIKLLYDPKLVSRCKNKWLFLDADVIIDALNYEELLNLLRTLKETEAELLTIQSVFFEFMRGTQSIEAFNANINFFENLVTVYQIENRNAKLDGLEDFIVVMARIGGNKSYADFLLAACLYLFKNEALVRTGNNKHFPTSIFDRPEIITADYDSEIKSYGVYKFSDAKFNRVAKSILAGK